MSDENEKLIEDTFITKLGAKYPFVKAKGCNEKYGIGYFPSVYCIAPDGRVFSVPDDKMPTEAQIEQLLKSVSLTPKMPEDAIYAPIKALWEKREYGKLKEQFERMLAQPNLDAAVREVVTGLQQELQKRQDAQQNRAEELGKEANDYGGASEQLARIEKEWKGFPAAATARQQLDRFATDPVIKKELAAAKSLQKLVAGFDPSRLAQAKKLAAELEKFAKQHEGTQAAKQADAQRKKLLKLE